MAARVAADCVGNAYSDVVELQELLSAAAERLSSIDVAAFHGYLRPSASTAYEVAIMAAIRPARSDLTSVVREMDRTLAAAGANAAADPVCRGCSRRISQCEC